MLGEDGEEVEGPQEGTFANKSVWARISVIAAGPIFNFILAFVLSIFIVGSIGYDSPVLLSVTEGGPAEEAGLLAGDEIVSIGGKRIGFTGKCPTTVCSIRKRWQKANP